MRVYHAFYFYPDPDQRFLRWIRIRNTACHNTSPPGRTKINEPLQSTLKLPFNVADDPYMAAQAFIHKNDLRDTNNKLKVLKGVAELFNSLFPMKIYEIYEIFFDLNLWQKLFLM